MTLFKALGIGRMISAVLLLSSCSTFYLGRYFGWNVPDLDDKDLLPARAVANEAPAFRFLEYDAEKESFLRLFETISYERQGEAITGPLEELLIDTGTTAFIVIQNDTILFEQYYNGYVRDSVNTSFSVAKSVISILTGIAVDEGYIESTSDSVTRYVPELKGCAEI